MFSEACVSHSVDIGGCLPTGGSAYLGVLSTSGVCLLRQALPTGGLPTRADSAY